MQAWSETPAQSALHSDLCGSDAAAESHLSACSDSDSARFGAIGAADRDLSIGPCSSHGRPTSGHSLRQPESAAGSVPSIGACSSVRSCCCPQLMRAVFSGAAERQRASPRLPCFQLRPALLWLSCLPGYLCMSPAAALFSPGAPGNSWTSCD